MRFGTMAWGSRRARCQSIRQDFKRWLPSRGVSRAQPLFLKDLLQRFTGILNVLAQQFARSRRVALAAEIQDLVMFLIGAFHAVSQVQLEARISFTTVVDVADNSHETRLIGARIEDRVKLPVKAPPRGEVIPA